MTDADLAHFHKAQTGTWRQVEAELAAGRKQSHWMWFVFPQIEGLGSSATAQRYAIRDRDQARRYLADPVLGPRLRRGVDLTLAHAGRSPRSIFGTPDDLKFRSCLTLFGAVAEDGADRALFERALAVFYDGVPDRRTLDRLDR